MQQIVPNFQSNDNKQCHCMVKLGGQFVDLQASCRCLAGQVYMGVRCSVVSPITPLQLTFSLR
eukprot:1161022-Pelagomonas_calceolata.AAC.3